MKIKRGCSRTVLLIGSWAIKVPTTRPYGRRQQRLWAWCRGYLANQSEVSWNGTDGTCPILWRLGSIVVCFKRAKHLDYQMSADEVEWWDAVAPALPFGDRKTENLGIVDGRIVWIDYDSSWNGCPHAKWNELVKE